MGANGGMNTSAADIIINFDEDWSGRGIKLLDSIVLKSNIRTHYSRKNIQFIKLLCENSCEECFLSENLIDSMRSSINKESVPGRDGMNATNEESKIGNNEN